MVNFIIKSTHPNKGSLSSVVLARNGVYSFKCVTKKGPCKLGLHSIFPNFCFQSLYWLSLLSLRQGKLFQLMVFFLYNCSLSLGQDIN